MSRTFSLPDEAATQVLGRALAAGYRSMRLASAGSVGPTGLAAGVIHVHGDLGAGKTTLVRAFLQALGVTGRVRSPTYTLVDSYELQGLTCVHVDLYRLRSSFEVSELALSEMLQPGTVMLIEWPERGGALVPTPDIELTLSYVGDGREARARGMSEVGKEWLLQSDVTLA